MYECRPAFRISQVKVPPPMARQRDYKAEYARRKARLASNPEAKRNYYRRQYETDVKRAIRKGYGSVRQEKAAMRTTRRTAPPKGYPSYDEMIRQSRRWTRERSKSEYSQYRPQDAYGMGITEAQYTLAFWEAWVRDYEAYRYKGGTDALRYWLVDLKHWDTTVKADYYDRYKQRR